MPTLPGWAIKLLPYVVGLLALAAAVWYIDHRGYERAQTEHDLQVKREENARLELKAAINQEVRDLEGRLQTIVDESDQRLNTRLSSLRVQERTIIQPTITKEIQLDPRFSDPNLGISDGMLNAINQARSTSGDACSATANC